MAAEAADVETLRGTGMMAKILSAEVAQKLITTRVYGDADKQLLDEVQRQVQLSGAKMAESFADVLHVFTACESFQNMYVGIFAKVSPFITDYGEQHVVVRVHNPFGEEAVECLVIIYFPVNGNRCDDFGLREYTTVKGGRRDDALFIMVLEHVWRYGDNNLPESYYEGPRDREQDLEGEWTEDEQGLQFDEGEELVERVGELEARVEELEARVEELKREAEAAESRAEAERVEREAAEGQLASLEARVSEEVAKSARLAAEQAESALLIAELRAKNDEASLLIAELRAKNDAGSALIADMGAVIVVHEADTVHNLGLIDELNREIDRMHSEDVEKCEWANEEMAALRARLQAYEGAQFAGCDQYSPCCEPLFNGYEPQSVGYDQPFPCYEPQFAGYDQLPYPCHGPQFSSHGLYTPFDRSNDGYLPYAGGHGQ